MPNTDLFRKIHDQITTHPESHDQGDWESPCGTTRCVAGWALHLTEPHLPVEVTARLLCRGVGIAHCDFDSDAIPAAAENLLSSVLHARVQCGAPRQPNAY